MNISIRVVVGDRVFRVERGSSSFYLKEYVASLHTYLPVRQDRNTQHMPTYLSSQMVLRFFELLCPGSEEYDRLAKLLAAF